MLVKRQNPHKTCVGEVAEWSKAQHWKCCVGQLTVGSNPTFSVTSKEALILNRVGAFLRFRAKVESELILSRWA